MARLDLAIHAFLASITPHQAIQFKFAQNTEILYFTANGLELTMKDTFRAFSTTDLSRRSGDVVAAALRAPVLLTQHKKARLIVLSVEEYELRTAHKAPDTRTAARLKDMPAGLADDFRAAAAAYMQDEDA